MLEFNEKPQTKEGLINGGYFVFNRRFFSYLNEDDNCILEREPLERLAKNEELMVYPQEGFWQFVDAYRELKTLNNLWATPKPPWKVWK